VFPVALWQGLEQKLVSRWTWHGALVAFALVMAVLGGGALALALGAANPPVAGPLILDEESWAIWLPEAWGRVLAPSHTLSPTSALTVEVTAALDGPADAAYGLWLQECADSRRVVFALDGEGFFALFEYPADEPPPWAWFLHAQPRPAVNRLRLHLSESKLTLRVNDEIAQVTAPVGPVCAVGLYAATEELGGARVRFERVQLWSVPIPD
jgi:hypothetical protein